MRFLFFTLVLLSACASDQPTTEINETDQPIEFWQTVSETDEFGEATGDTYQTAQIGGTRNGEPCQVDITRADSLLMFSFGSDGDTYTLGQNGLFQLSIRQASGETINTEVYLYNNAVTDTRNHVLPIIQQSEGPVKVLVDLNRAENIYTDKYLFELDPADFR